MNIYNNLRDYSYPKGDRNYRNFIREQKEALKNPALNQEQREAIIFRINQVIEKSKEKEKEHARSQLITEGTSTVIGWIGGPIATGIMTALSSEKPQDMPKYDIHKAQKCGKSRKVSKKQHPEKSTFTQKLAKGLYSGIYSAINPVGRMLSAVTAFIL